MRQHLPSGRLMILFLLVAVICTIIVHHIGPMKTDAALAGLSVPIFIGAALAGLRRNWMRQDAGDE